MNREPVTWDDVQHAIQRRFWDLVPADLRDHWSPDLVFGVSLQCLQEAVSEGIYDAAGDEE